MTLNKYEPVSLNYTKYYCAIFLILGICLRLFHYFYNRSLWMDEVYLSSSLIKMDYAELATLPLDFQQKAPIGFLWIVRFMVNLFGSNEMALRLWSLLCGIASLFVFIPVAKFFLQPKGLILGLGILALAPPLIFHSVEIKQYQTEMLATLLVLYAYVKYQSSYNYKSLIIWGALGSIIIWFSYSSIFILAGIGAGLTFLNLYRKKWEIALKQSIPFGIWLVSFVINYFLFTHKHAESKWIVYWFDFYHNFMPLPPRSIADIKWYATSFYSMIDYPLGLLWKFYNGDMLSLKILFKVPFLPVICLVAGILGFYKRKKELLILGFPFLFVFIASGLKLYPLTERFWVFISPILILFVANGYSKLSDQLNATIIRLGFAFLLLIGPLYSDIMLLVYPQEFFMHKKSFQRQALNYVNERFQPGDAVYVYWNDLPGFKVYERIVPLKFKAVQGADYRYSSVSFDDYLKKLKIDFRLSKNTKRIWFIYNDHYQTDIGDKIDEPSWYYLKGKNPMDRTLNYWSTLGLRNDAFKSFDVKISLVVFKTQ